MAKKKKAAEVVLSAEQAEVANIETSILNPHPPVTEREALRIAANDKSAQKSVDALLLAELRAETEPDAAPIPVTLTSDEIDDFFRKDRLEDIVSDFCQRRLPRLYRVLWGKKVDAAHDRLMGTVPDIDGNKVLRFYFEERNRLDRNQQLGSVEAVRKINPEARKIVTGQSGRNRLVRKDRSEGKWTKTVLTA